MRLFGHYRITTFQVIAFGFAALVLAGTLLLRLPVSSRQAGSMPFMDCLFTAVSSVCVTGLVVRDTASCWSPFGQTVILLLIQVGGLGVVTAAFSVAFMSGRRIGLMQRSVMQESIAAPQVGGIVRLTRFIVGTAFVIETAGALLLLPAMLQVFPLPKAAWYAVFHAVSAFCNAGFDLMGAREPFSSLTGFSQDAIVNITVMLLITVGGIGFLVWNDVREHGLRFKRYRLQSKIVLITSGIMILIPAAWLFLFELGEVSPGRRVLPALFQSVTLRTAGFNTVDLNGLSASGQGLMILWMLVGGSPGSTAGGMKTTTAAVLAMTAVNVFRRSGDVHFLGRRITDDTVRHAAAILVMYFSLFLAGGLAICRIEGLPLRACLFETASALGTVGLSLGITSGLGPVSRVILMLLMFLGRVGGLTLIYAAQTGRRIARSTMPLEKVTVG